MTVQAVADALNKGGVSGFPYDYLNYQPVGHEFILNVGGHNKKCVIVENQSTHTDDWSQRIWFTFQIGDQYFRRYGMYRSHYGEDWDYGETEEVFPKTVTVSGFYPA